MSGMIPGAAGSQEPELEYATKGTSARLVETEAAIKRVREACANGYPDAQYPWRCEVNDAEKIEALREWANQPVTDGAQLASLNWYREAQRQVRDIIDPPKPRWRELVGQAAKIVTDNPLEGVLKHLSVIASDPSPEGLEWNLARIVAICEAQEGSDWRADPEAGHADTCDLTCLLDAVGKRDTDWNGLGHRAANWLRSLTDEKPGTRTDAKYEHTLEPHCPVCFGVCAGSNRDGAA